MNPITTTRQYLRRLETEENSFIRQVSPAEHRRIDQANSLMLVCFGMLVGAATANAPTPYLVVPTIGQVTGAALLFWRRRQAKRRLAGVAA